MRGNSGASGLPLWSRGATRLRLLDVLTALVLLGVLIWASWKQFPAYRHSAMAPTAQGGAENAR